MIGQICTILGDDGVVGRISKYRGIKIILAVGVSSGVFNKLLNFNMAQINIETVVKNSENILAKVGTEAFVNWDEFTIDSAEVVKTIDRLNSSIAIFRDSQHKNFIQTMKKLKSLDLPDLIQAVNAKKLPKEALRAVLPRFKFEGENLELVESAETLKANAKQEYEAYSQKNKEFIAEMKGFIEYFEKKTEESGFKAEPVIESKELKATVNFNLPEETASKIASEVEIQYLPQTNKLIGLKTYSQIVDGTFRLVVDEHKRLTAEGRKKQRSLRANHPEYLKSLNEYLSNTEAMINEAQTMIAQKVGISEKQLGESEMALMERGMSQNLLMIQSGLRGKIKYSIVYAGNLSRATRM